MKGIVFTEFMEMIASSFGDDMVDNLIDGTDPASLGAYTSVGTYEFDELNNYIIELNRLTNIPVPNLVKSFGLHLGHTFTNKFSTFFKECNGTVGLLKGVHDHIHVEVQKLYPDAELPEFSFDDSDAHQFKLFYRSKRGLADLAEGLIEATMKHYQEHLKVSRHDGIDGDFHTAEFIISKD